MASSEAYLCLIYREINYKRKRPEAQKHIVINCTPPLTWVRCCARCPAWPAAGSCPRSAAWAPPRPGGGWSRRGTTPDQSQLSTACRQPITGHLGLQRQAGVHRHAGRQVQLRRDEQQRLAGAAGLGHGGTGIRAWQYCKWRKADVQKQFRRFKRPQILYEVRATNKFCSNIVRKYCQKCSLCNIFYCSWKACKQNHPEN